MISLVRLLLTSIILLLLPQMAKRWFLNMLGHKINRSAYIGFNIIGPNTLITLENGAKLNSFNYLNCSHIKVGQEAKIGRFNAFSGAFVVDVEREAQLANNNRLINKDPETMEPVFQLGSKSNITSHHYFDLSASITIADNTVIGGRGSQFWTHGFNHFELGRIRHRLHGEIFIGAGVYVASSCIINPGVSVANGVMIGAGTVVSKSILEDGFYVSTQLRKISITQSSFLERYCIERPTLNGGVIRRKPD